MISATALAQNEAIVQEGEIGISAGAAHYFGDLNNLSAINRPKPTLGIFFRKQFGNYVAIRLAGHYAEMGYSDKLSRWKCNKEETWIFNPRSGKCPFRVISIFLNSFREAPIISLHPISLSA